MRAFPGTLVTFGSRALTTATDWRGRVGDVWAAEWRRTDCSFAALAPILDAAILAVAPPNPFRALDIGCGAGATSLALAAARPDASISGVDLSPGLIEVAQDRVSSLPDGGGAPAFIFGDAIATARDIAPVDLFFSRHGVMFFTDPVSTFAALARAGSPGTRLVFSCFAERAANAWAVETLAAFGRDGRAPNDDAPGPFAFADPRRVAALLSRAGWTADQPRQVQFAYRAGGGDDPVGDAVSFFTRIGPVASLLRDSTSEDRPGLLDRLAGVCHRRLVSGAVEFPATAWIWSAHVPKENAP